MPSVLYCGDTSLETAAAYLAGMMTAWGTSFEYVRSDQAVTAEQVQSAPLTILSDYPASWMSSDVQAALIDHVNEGAGLLMIGGWESFHGAGGDWDATSIASLLPVVVQTVDDRMNCSVPVLVRKTAEHAITDGLPFAENPPVIGGFNRFAARENARTLLVADRLASRCESGKWSVSTVETHPLLVTGTFGKGRVAAIATDVAPHWVGGFVDWGAERVSGQAAGADAIEVGSDYSRFWKQLLTWVSQADIVPR